MSFVFFYPIISSIDFAFGILVLTLFTMPLIKIARTYIRRNTRVAPLLRTIFLFFSPEYFLFLYFLRAIPMRNFVNIHNTRVTSENTAAGIVNSVSFVHRISVQ